MSVAVLGAVSLDRYVVVPNFPPEDSMVFAEQQFTPVGGSGANIAANLAISGIEVDFFWLLLKILKSEALKYQVHSQSAVESYFLNNKVCKV